MDFFFNHGNRHNKINEASSKSPRLLGGKFLITVRGTEKRNKRPS